MIRLPTYFLLVVLALAVWVGVPMPILAAEAVRGKIKSISDDKSVLILRDDYGKNRTFHLAWNARVVFDDRESRITDLKVGDYVAVTYEEMGERLKAIAIQYSDRMVSFDPKKRHRRVVAAAHDASGCNPVLKEACDVKPS